jgi:uncharacterized protein (DUF58 family)
VTSTRADEILDPDVARRVRNLTFVARRATEGLLSGVHRSPHRGASVVFVDHRDYRAGDDFRLLDWRAFARTDRDVVKRFEQETQLRATLVLDRSGSMAYAGQGGPGQRGAGQGGPGQSGSGHSGSGQSGSGQSGPGQSGPTKSEHAAGLLAALAYLFIAQGDAVGGHLVADGINERIPIRGRPAHIDTVLRALARGLDAQGPTDLARALAQVGERAGRRGVIVIASDLLDLAPDALAPIGHLAARGNDVVVLHVLTPDEIEFPFDVPSRFEGCENEAPLEVDPAVVRDAYRAEIAEFIETTRNRCIAVGARYALCRTDTSIEELLAALLSRGKRRSWR